MGAEDEVVEGSALLPGREERRRAYAQLTELIERHLDGVGDLPVAPSAQCEELERRLRGFDFGTPVPLDELVEATGELLGDGIVHTSHPRYFGLFNPAPTFAGVLADALVAAFNPQLAVTSHAPAAVGERPTFYVSREAHDSFVKAARMTGLGQKAARSVPVSDDLRLDVEALRAAIERDRAAGERPFLVVATA